MVGDSHVGKVALAYRKLAESSGLLLDFVCAPGAVMRKLRFEGSKLTLEPDDGVWPDHSNRPDHERRNFPESHKRTLEQFMAVAGSNPIDLTRFDAIVLYGGYLVRSDERMRILGENSSWWNDQHDKTRYSAALWADYVALKLSKRLHCVWLEQLNDFIAAGGKVFSVAPPLYSELLFDPQLEITPQSAGMRSMPDDADFLRVEPWYERAITAAGSQYIPLPTSLFSSDRRATDKKFKGDHPSDYQHLNNAGGELVLDAILDALVEWQSTQARA